MWHIIPGSRLETRYVLRLIQGVVRSELTLQERYLRKRFDGVERLKACDRRVGAG